MMKRVNLEPPKVLDFRRDDRHELSTIITVRADYTGHAWIYAGDVDITEYSNQQGVWMVEAKHYGATDYDHDTAIVFRVKIAGVAFRRAIGGHIWIDGFIAGDDPDAFRVPQPGWKQLEGAIKCRHADCKAKDSQHLVVAEGKYIPPSNPELFDKFRGLQIEIVTGKIV